MGTDGAPREMDRRQLAEWCRDGGVLPGIPVRSLVPDVPLSWLQSVAPHVDGDLIDLPGFPPEPVSGWQSIASVLHCSRTFCFALSDDGLLIVNRDSYRTWTTLAELWGCKMLLATGKHLLLMRTRD